MNEFLDFACQMRSAKESNQIIQNPYYFVLKGNNLILNKKYDRAIVEYDKAIDLCPSYSLNARFNKANAILQDDPKLDGQERAREELKKASELIKKQFHPDLIAFHSMVSVGQESHGKLSEQVQHLMNILVQQENYIDTALESIDKVIKKDYKVKIEMVTLDEAFKNTETDHSTEIREAESNGLTHFYQVI